MQEIVNAYEVYDERRKNPGAHPPAAPAASPDDEKPPAAPRQSLEST